MIMTMTMKKMQGYLADRYSLRFCSVWLKVSMPYIEPFGQALSGLVVVMSKDSVLYRNHHVSNDGPNAWYIETPRPIERKFVLLGVLVVGREFWNVKWDEDSVVMVGGDGRMVKCGKVFFIKGSVHHYFECDVKSEEGKKKKRKKIWWEMNSTTQIAHRRETLSAMSGPRRLRLRSLLIIFKHLGPSTWRTNTSQ